MSNSIANLSISSAMARKYSGNPDFYIAKRKGNKVRFRNRVTGKWDGWISTKALKGMSVFDSAQVVSVPPGVDTVSNYFDDGNSPKFEMMEADTPKATVNELRQLAKSKGLRGYSKLNKADLFSLIADSER